MQGFVAAGVVSLILLACYHYQASEGIWRISFGLGIVVSKYSSGAKAFLIKQVPISICFFRVRMINSTQYSKHAIKSNYPYMLVLKRYWKPMLGTCGSYLSRVDIDILT